MGAYVLRRLLLMVPTLLGILLVNFVLVQFMPGGPIEQIIARLAGRDLRHRPHHRRRPETGERRRRATTTAPQGLPPEFIAELEKQFGFDKPPLAALPADAPELPDLQLRRELLPLDLRRRPGAREDAGLDHARPLVDAARLPDLDPARHPQGDPRRLALRHRDERPRSSSPTPSRPSSSRSCCSCSSPAAATGGIFPLRGLTSDNWAELSLIGKVLDYLWHITLPVIASTIGAFATMTLLTKNSFLDEIKKQYVITARAKGLTERRVLYGHVFRNAMLIVIAGFPAVFICVFFGGSLIIETIFSLDGLGRLAYESAHPARLPGGLRHALRLRPDRPRRRAPLRPHLRLGRSAHRLREPRDLMRLTALQRRRLANFRANRRAFWSLWIFLALFLVTLCAEFVANDRPLAGPLPGRASTSRSSASTPRPTSAASSQTEAEYASPEVRCLIRTGGVEACLDDPDGVYAGGGRPRAPPTASRSPSPAGCSGRRSPTASTPSTTASPPPPRRPTATTGSAPTTRPATCSPASSTASASRCCSRWSSPSISSLIGIVAGACQGFFGGWVDLVLPAHRRDLGEHAEPLHHHHPLGDLHDELLAADAAHRLLLLDQPRRRRPRRVPARPQLRIRPRRPRARRSATSRSCSATCCRTPWWRP